MKIEVNRHMHMVKYVVANPISTLALKNVVLDRYTLKNSEVIIGHEIIFDLSY